MHELTAICRATRELRAKGEPLWLATVVAVRGSAYRQPGARLLFTRERVLAGSVSGGCLESDIVRSGSWATAAGPIVRTYDTADDEVALAHTGCGGRVEILLENISSESRCDAVSFIARCMSGEARAVIATVIQSRAADVRLAGRLLFDAGSRTTQTDLEHPALVRELTVHAQAAALRGATHHYIPASVPEVQVLIEVIDPRPALFIFGTGPDALELVHAANLVGWNTMVFARQLRPAVQNRFCHQAHLIVGTAAAAVAELDRRARPLAVVMSHDIDADREALSHLLHSRARYIGVLGPASRTAQLLNEIRSAASSRSERASRYVYGPAGLDLGAESPAEIALSIVAEAQAALRAASCHSLRDRKRPIHERTSETPELRLVAQERGT